jgi:hypothetical protein
MWSRVLPSSNRTCSRYFLLSLPVTVDLQMGIVISTDCATMSPVVYGGKMSAQYCMENENLYVSFFQGLGDGHTAHVLGTWTQDAGGNKKAQLAMANYTCKSVTDTEYSIVKEGGYYRLKIVVSGDKLEVVLQNKWSYCLRPGHSFQAPLKLAMCLGCAWLYIPLAEIR